MNVLQKREQLQRRQLRVRQRVFGTPERPRLNVYRSERQIYAQIIDDTSGRTLAAASSLDAPLRESLRRGGNVEAAKAVGQLLADRATAKDIRSVVFDRGGRRYHGRIKALAEASRERGLQF